MFVDHFEVVVHYRGHFISNEKLEYDGETITWFCSPDTWGYFEVIVGLKELGHVALKELWYCLGGGSVLKDRLDLLCDDKRAMHIVNLTRLNGVVHLYVVHEMTIPEILNMIEGASIGAVGPFEVNDVDHCVNEGDEHGDGLGEVVGKDGDEGKGDVTTEVVLGNGDVDEGECENDGYDHGKGASEVLAKEGDQGKSDVATKVVLGERVVDECQCEIQGDHHGDGVGEDLTKGRV